MKIHRHRLGNTGEDPQTLPLQLVVVDAKETQWTPTFDAVTSRFCALILFSCSIRPWKTKMFGVHVSRRVSTRQDPSLAMRRICASAGRVPRYAYPSGVDMRAHDERVEYKRVRKCGASVATCLCCAQSLVSVAPCTRVHPSADMLSHARHNEPD